jgi:hypothetical protein
LVDHDGDFRFNGRGGTEHGAVLNVSPRASRVRACVGYDAVDTKAYNAALIAKDPVLGATLNDCSPGAIRERERVVTAMRFRFDAPCHVRLLPPKLERSGGKEHTFTLDLIATLTQALYGYAKHPKRLDDLVERPSREIE